MYTIDFGNETIFRELFNDYYHPLCFYAARIIGDDNPVHDIVQDIFLRIWERRLVFESTSHIKAYLYSSVYNACINLQKSVGTHQRHHIIIKNEAAGHSLDELSFLSDRIEAEVFSEIFKAIEQLPMQCRKIFELSYIRGMSVENVAMELDISVNTVKTQRSRAKKLLRESLKDLYSILVIAFFLLD